jgi:hypothetical protein
MRAILIALFVTTCGVCFASRDKTCPPSTDQINAIWLHLAAEKPEPEYILEVYPNKDPLTEQAYCVPGHPGLIGIEILEKGKVLHSITLKVSGKDAEPPAKGSKYWLYTPSERDAKELAKYRAKGDLIRIWAQLRNGKHVKPVLAVKKGSEQESKKKSRA